MKTTFDISTKKGETQSLRWLVRQSIPYPDIEGHCGSLRWRNGGGLFPEYGQKPTGIGNEFICYLLAPVAVIEGDAFNRTHFAGFADYHTKAVNPGAMTLRGKSLGEMSVTFANGFTWPTIKVNGYDTPSPGERAAIIELVVPKLQQFIEENKKELYNSAAKQLKEHIANKIRDARNAVDDLETKAAEALKTL